MVCQLLKVGGEVTWFWMQNTKFRVVIPMEAEIHFSLLLTSYDLPLTCLQPFVFLPRTYYLASTQHLLLCFTDLYRCTTLYKIGAIHRYIKHIIVFSINSIKLL